MLQIRMWTRKDLPAILALLHTDQLPGQPACLPIDLTSAIAGQGTIDRVWWDALATVQTIVATSGKDIVGAASYGMQKQAPVDQFRRMAQDVSSGYMHEKMMQLLMHC